MIVQGLGGPISPLSTPVETLLITLHYAYPALVLLYYLGSSAVAMCFLPTPSSSSSGQAHPRFRAINWLFVSTLLTFLVQLVLILVESILHPQHFSGHDTVVSLLSCILIFGLLSMGFPGKADAVWFPFVGPCIIGLVCEPLIEVLTCLTRPRGLLSVFRIIEIATITTRCLDLLLLVIYLYLLQHKQARTERGSDAERQSLLQPAASTSNNTQYGAADGGRRESQSTGESAWERREREAREQMERRLHEHGNWITYVKGLLVFLPLVWPVGKTRLQIRALLVGLCLLAMNVVHLLTPRQLGIVLDSFSSADPRNPWVQIGIFALLRVVQCEAGIPLLRSYLWIPIEYYSYETISNAAYSHVLNLSCDFHDTKSSSDIIVAIQNGQNVSNLLESICFRAIPSLVDMCVAFVYLSVLFGPYEGLITMATAIVFLHTATHMIARLKPARRREVKAYFDERAVRQAGIQGWNTVACFNQIGHEERRHADVVQERVSCGQNVWLGYVIAYALQGLVLLAGLLAGAFLAAYQVTHGQISAGQFAMLLTYWGQLSSPLTFFATLGKTLSRELIQVEQLIEILQAKPTVVNKPDAKRLDSVKGRVDFRHVDFSYDNKKQILKDVNFAVAPGTTVAFVGATGAGKSTILKLLDRFYDVTAGAVEIDGHDLRDVDLFSLRSHIGIVPQAPVLFDDTVLNNVRYGRLSASDEEVFDACRAAAIHDHILTFSDGYNTRVGERGVKLSGGELQRVAIARAMLKKPSIVLLDEATSAVDTDTEQKIQEALHRLSEGRTTFVVAHRLSTIMNADRIIVISDGQVGEMGGHDELMHKKGKYAELWSKQVFIKPKGPIPSPIDTNNTDNAHNGEGNGNSNDKSPIIVNDISAEAAETELAKAAAASEEAGVESWTWTDGAHDSRDDRPVAPAAPSPSKSVPGHQKEASRLNPGAPVFTPRSAVGSSNPTPVSPLKLGSPAKPDETHQTRLDSNDGTTTASSEAVAGNYSTQQLLPPQQQQQQQPLPQQQPPPPMQFVPAPFFMMRPVFPLYQPALPQPPTTMPQQGEAETLNNLQDERPPVRKNHGDARDRDRESEDENAADETHVLTDKISWRHPRYLARVQSKSDPTGGGKDLDSDDERE